MASEEPPFILDLRGVCGAHLATIVDGEESRLHEYTTWLRLRSDVTGFVAPTVTSDDEVTGFVPPAFDEDGIAALVHARNHQDLPDEAIGLHHGRLEPEQLAQIRAAVAGIEWRRLPMPKGGDRYATHFTLRYVSGKLMIERRFNAESGNFIEAIAPVWVLLRDLGAQVLNGRSGTLEPVLDVLPNPEPALAYTFRVGLRNRGLGPVALTDPRVPSPVGRARIELRVGERFDEREGMSARDWTVLEVPGPPEARTCMVAARRRWEVEVPWVAPKPGRYEVQFRWLDYGGPLDALPGQTPFMPLPTTGPAFIGSGPYPVRGSCWTAVRFDVPDPSARR